MSSAWHSGSRVVASLLIGILASLWLLAAAPARAHTASVTSAAVQIEPDASIHVSLHFNVLAFALNDIPARLDQAQIQEFLEAPQALLDSRVAAARQRLTKGIKITTDHGEVPLRSVSFPTSGEISEGADSGPVFLLNAEVAGSLPPSASVVTFRFPEVIGPVVLTVERPGEESFCESLQADEPSSSLSLQNRAAPISPAESWPRMLGAFIVLGFRHIVPEGLDHILFVLGLVLLNLRLRPLAWQVSAFTLAHSITLGLSVYGVVRLPSQVVEPLIALSIAFVAVENLFTTELKPWRVTLVFLFGLIHGLGFAGALQDVGLVRHNFLSALVGFNAGVELGQLAVVALTLAVLRAARNLSCFRQAIVMPASGAIALVAMVWAFQRLNW